jgi:mRNA interferase RelE/StbE
VKGGYRTRFKLGARADLRAIDKTAALAILKKLAELEQDPYGFDTTALKSRPGVRRLRIGDYRAWYTINESEVVIWVIRVGHRSTVYDR